MHCNPRKLKHTGLWWCVRLIHPMGLLNMQTFEFTPSKHFYASTFCELPYFTSSQKNTCIFKHHVSFWWFSWRKFSSIANFSWSFVRWAMLQTVDGAISPTGMMQRTLQLLMSQVSHITCCPILPAPTLDPMQYYTQCCVPCVAHTYTSHGTQNFHWPI